MEKIDIPVCIMLVGLPGSGKSTFADNISKNIDVVIHLTDAIRKELFGDENDQQNPQLVFETAYKRIRRDLQEGYNVVFDATNLRQKNRQMFLQYISDIPHRNICVLMKTPFKECVRRNDMRERRVPRKVLFRMKKAMEFPTIQEGFEVIKRVKTLK